MTEPDPRDLLDRPHLRALRRLSAAQLRRIDAATAERGDPGFCPLARATGRQIPTGWTFALALGLPLGARTQAADEADCFITAWDAAGLSRAWLAEAVAEAIAEAERREGTE